MFGAVNNEKEERMAYCTSYFCATLLIVEVIPVFTTSWSLDNVWSYDVSSNTGPNRWNLSWPDCSGSEQSPVDIDTHNVWYSNSLTSIEMVGYESIPPNTHWELVNVGHAVHLEMESDYRLRDGGLPGEYRALYLTFHWGPTNITGTEHTIDGRAYAMEIQVVHYNLAYNSYEEALAHPDGIAILSYLLETKPYGNPSLSQIVSNLPSITEEGSSIPLRPIPLLSLFPVNTNNYYRYHGSMTTPPCLQVVEWTVFSEIAIISEKQLEAFRLFRSYPSEEKKNKYQHRFPTFQIRNNLRHSSVGHCRPLQPLGGRTVYSSHTEHATLLTSMTGSTLSILMASSLGFIIILLVLSRPSKEYSEHPLDHHED